MQCKEQLLLGSLTPDGFRQYYVYSCEMLFNSLFPN